MRIASRVATSSAALVITLIGVTGCSGGTDQKADTKPTESAVSGPDFSTESVAPETAEPALKMGQTGTYVVGTTSMEITPKGVKYVTPSDVGTETPPRGQYAVLTLTVKNVGSMSGPFKSWHSLKWFDATTAMQDVSTAIGTPGLDVDTTYAPGQSVTGDIVLDVVRRGGSVGYYEDGVDIPAFSINLPK
ncbi:DUF4352 domain-containing protein [Streptomyces albipurpureus]|uniref:DUF4352 domain-containing protein n=1 Tax=Streptomyces albipurpureus TaxID=2897419 RepID=A0ABT0UTJ1_9ACTN|nr:DUF4352 domain-containing protein [Streptomyces sp. CWNU-1]MCM2391697.1 DUF4352 domain-containing protein [Streptomyces sp. CWNU-1]